MERLSVYSPLEAAALRSRQQDSPSPVHSGLLSSAVLFSVSLPLLYQLKGSPPDAGFIVKKMHGRVSISALHHLLNYLDCQETPASLTAQTFPLSKLCFRPEQCLIMCLWAFDRALGFCRDMSLGSCEVE